MHLGSLATDFVFSNVYLGGFFFHIKKEKTSQSWRVKRHCDHLAMLELSYIIIGLCKGTNASQFIVDPFGHLPL